MVAITILIGRNFNKSYKLMKVYMFRFVQIYVENPVQYTLVVIFTYEKEIQNEKNTNQKYKKKKNIAKGNKYLKGQD